jgi:hypothetical protein
MLVGYLREASLGDLSDAKINSEYNMVELFIGDSTMLDKEKKRAIDRAYYARKVGREIGKPGRPANTPEVLWSKVDKRGEDECWNWLAYKNDDGYGRVQINDYSYYAHRVIYCLAKPGEIEWAAPKSTDEFGFLLHTCDNPSCCNPKHLWVGTHKENMEDKARKGRSPDFSGGKSPKCKITMVQAREARELRKAGVSARELAKKFEISLSSMKTLLRGNSYKE